MNDLELVEKTCTRCGETKPGSEFGRHANGRLVARCKPCVTAVTKAYQTRLRAEIGEEEHRRIQRERVQRAREKSRDYDNTYRRARDQAVRALIDAHAKEFEELFRRAKYEAGLL